MPIEDVDYLKANSVKQSYLLLVDSADRDRSAYPTPSDYVVSFSAPFQNVVGMEVVDASIPRTMYSIDVINNKISFLIHSGAAAAGPSGVAGAWDRDLCRTVTLETGEYTIQTLIPALTSILTMNVDNDPAQPVAGITVESVSNPQDIKNTIQFRCPYPFFLNMEDSTMAETLGFDMYTSAFPRESDSNVTPLLAQRYTAPVPDTTRVYHSVDLPFSVGSNVIPTETAFSGPRGILRSLPLSATAQAAQRFQVPADTYLTQIFAALTTDTQISSYGGVTPPASLAAGATWEVRRGTSNAPAPPSDLPGARVATGTIALSFTDGTLSDSNRVAAPIAAGEYYWLILGEIPEAGASAGLRVYYNDVLTTESTLLTSTVATAGSSNALWGPTATAGTPDAEEIYNHLSVNIMTTDDYHKLVAPGIYSLIGPRYITLRCPEIEENAFRSLSYTTHNLGLAKIRLGVVGYSENRLDYSKVPIREFHPIGKLARMTLRFVLPSGELYDFKGVNHTITFAIHYYEPAQKQLFSRSIINPNYNGNLIEYMYRQEDQESDSTDQEEDFNRDALVPIYQYHERNFMPENSERRDQEALYHLQRERETAALVAPIAPPANEFEKYEEYEEYEEYDDISEYV